MRAHLLLTSAAIGATLLAGGATTAQAAPVPSQTSTTSTATAAAGRWVHDGNRGETSQSAVAVPSWCARGEVWNTDGRTVGVRCDVTFAYYAKVTCTNGTTKKVARGVTTNDNRWSYAYCTSFGSSYRVVAGTAGPVRA
ncbi:hypothetical protein [Streptomyces sp. Rer75]|uniref:hypothetical protein n=1 Tax=unclassified Streptomyces TaxID=2593676 RepID=UPI0015D0758E|nr:hypothetical protein [Streptomyces sp. Rer75]QLH24225.1 hypothetical protein HYQ63_29325 [Streptomyces sp. Rer75]